MIKGDNVLITYTEQNNKTVLATFYELSNGMYFFNDVHGVFAVSEKSAKAGKIVFEIVEE